MANTAVTGSATTQGGMASTQSKLQGLVAEHLKGKKKAEKGLEKYLKDPATKAIARYAKVRPEQGQDPPCQASLQGLVCGTRRVIEWQKGNKLCDAQRRTKS